jgi:hypothetical protein
MLFRYFGQRDLAVCCLIEISESQLRQKLSNDASDGTAVIYYQDAAEVMDSHFPSPKAWPFQVSGMFTQPLREITTGVM